MKSHRFTLFHSFPWLLIFLAVAMAAHAADPKDAYVPLDTQDPETHPPTPEEAAAAITMPEGFQARLFAGEPDVRQPIAMAFDDRGRLWVAESYSYQEWETKGEDRILIFEDTDNDGRHDSRKVFWTGGNHVSAMVPGWGGVWVGDAPNLLFIPDRDRDDVPDGEPEVVLDGWTTEAQHNFINGLTWGIDGWLYGRHGIKAPSLVGKPGTPESERTGLDCSIWRYHPVTQEFEVVCRGTTNPWGLDWNDKGDAFFTNNVTGHLFHAIHGAFFPRMGDREDPFCKYVYSGIPMCADHLHHAGTTDDWTKTRDAEGVHGELGGGHSHCGGMVYLGGKWPEEYRNTMFLCNTHGRRLNNDTLERHRSGYVAKHRPDFMLANNDWFRGVTVLYGPDGDVFLSDWVDLGECHDRDGVHRSSGRIYKLIYGEPSPPKPVNLWEDSDTALAKYQLDGNEWYARMARHVLQQRCAAGTVDKNAVGEVLIPALINGDDTALRLRAFLTMHVIEAVPGDILTHLMDDGDEYLRAMAIRLSTEYPFTEDENLTFVVSPEDPSPLVRLAWTKLLQRAEGNEIIWRVAQGLAGHTGDADDPNLPLMIWFGIKDDVADFPEQAISLAERTTYPTLHHHVARRLGESGHYGEVLALTQRVAAMEVMGSEKEFRDQQTSDLLAGLVEGLKGQTDLKAPEGWAETYAAFKARPDLRSLAFRLQESFDPVAARQEMKDLLASSETSLEEKRIALEILTTSGDKAILPSILALLDDKALRSDAIQALKAFKEPEVSKALLERFEDFDSDDQLHASNTLTSNPKFAGELLKAMGEGKVPRHAITAYHARQIQNFKKDDLKKLLAKNWGSMGQSSGEKKETITYWENQLTPDVLAHADIENGHAKFQMLCMACHTLHGEGGQIGPELTGANRGDVFYLLENVIDPSATLPQDFRLTIITLKDGGVLSGNVISENEYSLTLRDPAGHHDISIKDIKERQTLEQSLMPEGLLSALKPDEVRDLIAYLQK